MAKPEAGFGLQGPCLHRALPVFGGVSFEIGSVKPCKRFAKLKLGFPELPGISGNQVYTEIKENEWGFVLSLLLTRFNASNVSITYFASFLCKYACAYLVIICHFIPAVVNYLCLLGHAIQNKTDNQISSICSNTQTCK